MTNLSAATKPAIHVFCSSANDKKAIKSVTPAMTQTQHVLTADAVENPVTTHVSNILLTYTCYGHMNQSVNDLKDLYCWTCVCTQQ